ncbi:MAG: FCD domain-containing protein, partial [Chloroflexi bacterium]
SQVAQDRLHDHERILQAVIDRDPEAVAEAMREHLQKARQILMAGEPTGGDG